MRMNKYDQNKELSCLMNCDANSLYRWAMSQKVPVDGNKWGNNRCNIDEKFIKCYDEDSSKGYIFEACVQYPEKFNDLHNDLAFLPKGMKVKNCNKFLWNLYNNEKYIVEIAALKQVLNPGFTLKSVYIDLNTKLDINTKVQSRSKKTILKRLF